MSAHALHATTAEIASITVRILCRHAKPAIWVDDFHPAFRSARRAELRVVVFHDASWTDLPWVAPDTVRDEAEVTRARGWAQIRSDYFAVTIDPLRRRVRLRIAPGFFVDGAMRAIWSLLLLERGGVLLRARRVAENGGACLVLDDETPCLRGLVAVVPTSSGLVTYPTPFEAEESDEAPAPLALRGIRIGATPAGSCRRLAPVAAVGALARHVRIDRGESIAAATVDILIGLAERVPCEEVSDALAGR